jgi:hypothetical protein
MLIFKYNVICIAITKRTSERKKKVLNLKNQSHVKHKNFYFYTSSIMAKPFVCIFSFFPVSYSLIILCTLYILLSLPNVKKKTEVAFRNFFLIFRKFYKFFVQVIAITLNFESLLGGSNLT